MSGGVDSQGRIVISTYPTRAKARNAQTDPRVSVLVLSDDWNGPWVQVDGDAEVLHMPEAADGLVDYFRCISGEHPDWDEYRQAMRDPGQVADSDYSDALGPDRHGRIPGRRGRAARRLIGARFVYAAWPASIVIAILPQASRASRRRMASGTWASG